MFHPNYICIEDFLIRINAIMCMCMYYIRTIWLKVEMNFCTYCYSARQWLRVGASA